MIQCYLDMHKPSTTSKPQSPSKRKPSLEQLLDNPGWEAQWPRKSSEKEDEVRTLREVTGRPKKQLAFLWTVAEHLISSFVNLWGL